MFSNRIAPPAPPNRLSQRREELAASGVKLCNLAESNPSRCGLVHEAVLEHLRNPAALKYVPHCQGLPSARNALATENGSKSEDIFLCASTSEAYSWLFKLLCDPGECVMVPKPGYPLFDYLAGLEAVRTESYRLEYVHPAGWHIDLTELAERMRRFKPRALVLINPNNPTGSFISGHERAEIERLAREQECALIVDEVFLPFPLETTKAVRSFRDSTKGLVFCLNGLSKMLCLPQIKLGWIELAGSPELKTAARQRLEVIADSYLSAGVVPMLALPSLLTIGRSIRETLGLRLATNMATLHRVFDGQESPYRVLRCDGGWTALVEVPRYLPEEELCLYLLDTAHIIVFPGYFFDCERTGILAVSLILPEESFVEGIGRLKEGLDRLGDE